MHNGISRGYQSAKTFGFDHFGLNFLPLEASRHSG
jgi:hypothetical protein